MAGSTGDAVNGEPAGAASPTVIDVAELVPCARHIHPAELTAGDLLFDTSGRLHPITDTTAMHGGNAISALLDDGHRVWLWNAEPIIAVLARETPPSVTFYERVFDPLDSAGWAAGDPRVIDIVTDTAVWEPDDGNPIAWAVDQLGRHGTLEASSSPPFTTHTWYSHTGVDFARSGATVDTSAHLSGFTPAEAEAIGARITAPPRRTPTPAPEASLMRAPVLAASRGRAPGGLIR
ncbi:MAG: hypothetical protein BGO26_01310 [Actinobacteria bacterium 69-20]|nr:MAG: hypothetical protein BGO26_01310 [Actinobacteria bacterium 69-20]